MSFRLASNIDRSSYVGAVVPWSRRIAGAKRRLNDRIDNGPAPKATRNEEPATPLPEEPQEA